MLAASKVTHHLGCQLMFLISFPLCDVSGEVVWSLVQFGPKSNALFCSSTSAVQTYTHLHLVVVEAVLHTKDLYSMSVYIYMPFFVNITLLLACSNSFFLKNTLLSILTQNSKRTVKFSICDR